MKSVLYLVAIFVFVQAANAWVPNGGVHHGKRYLATGRTKTSSATVSLNLTPSQAQELADCAHDLMKQAMEEKAKGRMLSRDVSKKLKMESQGCLLVDGEEEIICGPVSWARKRLWPFKNGRTGREAVASKMP